MMMILIISDSLSLFLTNGLAAPWLVSASQLLVAKVLDLPTAQSS
jgi:hypothetical protein